MGTKRYLLSIAHSAAYYQALENGGWNRGNRPVMGASWEDPQRHVNWLAQKTGHPCRWHVGMGSRSWHGNLNSCHAMALRKTRATD